MESIAEKINEAIEFPIDFVGQKKADIYAKYGLVFTAVLSVVSGLVTDNIFVSAYVFGACLLAVFAVVLPPYPFYKKNPSQWLQVKYEF